MIAVVVPPVPPSIFSRRSTTALPGPIPSPQIGAFAAASRCVGPDAADAVKSLTSTRFAGSDAADAVEPLTSRPLLTGSPPAVRSLPESPALRPAVKLRAVDDTVDGRDGGEICVRAGGTD